MPTKDEIEAENAQLRERVAELEAAAPAPAGAPPVPKRPDYLSSGEAYDLEQVGVTRSPFDGSEINALDEGVEPGNPEARRNAEAAQERARARSAAVAAAEA